MERKVIAVLGAAAAAPAAFLAWLIYRFGVNVPFWDQWAIAPIFQLYRDHQLSFAYLISQHNESRKFFPRLLFLFLGRLTHWDVRWEMAVQFLMACGTSAMLWVLSRRSIRGGPAVRLALLAMANLLIFSPAGQENWVWGIQVVVVVPILCLTVALVAAESKMHPLLRVVAGGTLATIATYSYANGMLCWPLILVALIASNPWRPAWWALALFAVVGVAEIAYFFHGYVKPPTSPDLHQAVATPRAAVTYFLAFLGAPFRAARELKGVSPAVTAGVVLLLASAAAVGGLLRRWRDVDLWRHAMPWLIVAVYTGISAVLTTAGRVGFGIEQSLSSRYQIFAAFLPVALIYLAVVLYERYAEEAPRHSALRLGARVATVIVVASFVGLGISTSAAGVRDLRVHTAERLRGKAAVEFLPLCRDDDGLQALFPNTQALAELAMSLDRMGYLNPPMIRSRDVRPLEAPASRPAGWFDVLSRDPDGKLFAQGWSRLPERSTPADAVLFTCRMPDGEDRLLAATEHRSRRPDVEDLMHNDAYARAGWWYYLTPDQVPAGAPLVTAWAFDARTEKAYRIGELPIPAVTVPHR